MGSNFAPPSPPPLSMYPSPYLAPCLCPWLPVCLSHLLPLPSSSYPSLCTVLFVYVVLCLLGMALPHVSSLYVVTYSSTGMARMSINSSTRISALWVVHFSWHEHAAQSPRRHPVALTVAETNNNNRTKSMARCRARMAGMSSKRHLHLLWARAPGVLSGRRLLAPTILCTRTCPCFQAHLMKHKSKLHNKAASSGFTDAQKTVVDHILLDKIKARRKVR